MALCKFNVIKSIYPPKGVDVLNVWADLDRSEAGYNAALKLRERMKLVNVKVNILMPPQELNDEKSIDWNDILIFLGKSYFS
ncbi:toprim domain-containing protein [Psychromonas sp. KJ10-2]|uniref:toprim domain-containing protein n=1 Tax=Psychromonas sp. KJ10-2 TaxID=3391822 RepID=UPI0039B4B7EB